jgi:hypothetical protein
MQNEITNQLLEHLDSVIKLFEDIKDRYKYDDFSDVNPFDLHSLISKARSAIERVSGPSSAYTKHAEGILAENIYDGGKALMIVGVIQSLRADIEAGFIGRIEELIHGEVFADFLEMARYLLDEGYKDAAAVIAGSTLESHLRQVCTRHKIETEVAIGSDIRPKKADRINAELSKASIYSILDQKNITAWLDLRNKAAHGNYNEYSKEQVSLLIDGVRDFITRTPA